MSYSLRPYGLWSARLLCPWDSPGKNTGVGCHAFLGDLRDPGTEPTFLISPALADRVFTTTVTWEAPNKPFLYLQNISGVCSFLTTSTLPPKARTPSPLTWTTAVTCQQTSPLSPLPLYCLCLHQQPK